jgi:hypothetical protein
MEVVDDESKITLDIIECSGYKLEHQERSRSTVNNALRFRDIKDYREATADVLEFKQAFPKVNYRYYAAPSEALPSGAGMLDADNATSTFPMQLVGRKDGANAVKSGEGFMFQ